MTTYKDGIRQIEKLIPEAQAEVDRHKALGWKQTFYALADGCVSCPNCEVLHHCPVANCYNCGWAPK